MNPIVYGSDVFFSQPERIVGVVEIRQVRQRRKMRAADQQRVRAPDDHDHHHHRGHVHDAQRFLARFVECP